MCLSLRDTRARLSRRARIAEQLDMVRGDGANVLDVVRDDPGLRLGCLELFVRLFKNGCSPHMQPDCQTKPDFTVEEDQRQRVLVQWEGSGFEDQVDHNDHEARNFTRKSLAIVKCGG